MGQKLTENFKAVQLLRAKFKSGEVMGDEQLKAVWESEQLFRSHKLNNFRTKFNKIRKELQNDESLEEPPNDGLNRRMTGSDHLSGSKKRRLALQEDSSDEDLEKNFDDYKASPSDLLSFKPLHLISEWKEPGTMTQCFSVAILLPSGIGEGYFAWRVVEDGRIVELTATWPLPLLEPVIMHKKWLNKDNREGFEVYHPKVVGFQLALKQLRKRNSDIVKSVAKIPLPFAVQAHVRADYNIAWRDSSARMVYLDLMAVVEQYAHGNNQSAFEVL